MTPTRLDEAEKFGSALNSLVWELDVPETPRCRAAATSFGIARDHHAAIVLLLRNDLLSSAFALLRCLFEAYLRGLWLRHCATDAQIEAHFDGANPPTTMVAEIEAIPSFSNGVLSEAKRKNWDVMCQYTHAGGLHLKQWQRACSIEPSFPDEELENGIALADRYAALASLELAQMAVHGDGGAAVLALIRERFSQKM